MARALLHTFLKYFFGAASNEAAAQKLWPSGSLDFGLYTAPKLTYLLNSELVFAS